MIAKLTGIVDSAGADSAILDVGGVGYLVFASARTLRALPPPGEPASLLIETEVREDAFNLYGFAESAERDWFRLLRSVQGVGVKVALALLSALSGDELGDAIAHEDAKMLTRAHGVGNKLAVRIVNELKDKVAAAPSLARADGEAAGLAPKGGAGPDAVSALVNLGYRPADALAAIAAAEARLGAAAGAAELIRGGLKELSR